MKTRRDFLKSSSLFAAAAMAGMSAGPQLTFAQQAGGKTLVKIFMRGGADGLHLFPMVGDMNYYRVRDNIAIEPPSGSDANTAIDLGYSGTMRGMNPNLEPLMEIWNSGRMMIAPASGLTEGNRSHFDVQRWIGTGTNNNRIDGYLNRYMQNTGGAADVLRGAVLGKASMSTEIRGSIVVPAITRATDFDVRNRDFCSGSGCSDNRLTEIMAEIASHDILLPELEEDIRKTHDVTVKTIDRIQAAEAAHTTNAGGMDYTNSDLGRGLRLVAQLLKAGEPLDVAALDWNIGWDTHENQIAVDSADRFIDQDKRYHRSMRAGAENFLTFFRDIGALLDDVVVVVGTEFGRTVYENGSNGTDHGMGGAWFAFGGPTRRVIANDVMNLADENLDGARYVPVVVDYRDMVGEIMARHMMLPENLISTVFPGHNFTDYGLFSAMS